MNQTSNGPKSVEWAALTMGIFLTLSFGTLSLLSVVLAVLGLTSLPKLNTSEPLSLLILALGLFGLALLLLPGIYLNGRKLFHLPDAQLTFPTINDQILIPAIVVTWLLTLAIGQQISSNQTLSMLILPLANLLATGLPILLYVRISLRGLEFPSARRGWSIFGSSIIISPFLALIFEVISVGAIFVLFMIYASFVPGLKDVLFTLGSAITSGSNNEAEMTRLVAKLFYAPGIAVAALAAFSLAIPLIEETFKLTVLWFYFGRIRRPLDGFVLGILCGAAFALGENIGFTSAGAADWAASAVARSTSALPHIFNSGLLGWALVSAWKEQRYGRLLGAFSAVLLVHGAWNAISLGLALNTLTAYVAVVPFFLQSSLPWYAGWSLLALGAFGGLIFNNHQMRQSLKNEPAAKLGYNRPLLSQTFGEKHDGSVEKSD